jgi:hypothetical protein
MLADPTDDAYAWHGHSMDIAGDRIVVGASLDDTDAGDGGMAYVWDARTGDLLRRIHSPQPQHRAVFGDALAAQGDKFAIRRVNILPDGNKGIVDVFDIESGTLLFTLDDPESDSGEKFGRQMAFAGDQLLVGNPTGDVAFLYDADTGELLNTYRGAAGSGFGTAVAGSEGQIVIGAPDEAVGELTPGALHLFEAIPEVTTTQSANDGSYHFAGLPPGQYRLRAFQPADLGKQAAMHEQTIEIENEDRITANIPVPAGTR